MGCWQSGLCTGLLIRTSWVRLPGAPPNNIEFVYWKDILALTWRTRVRIPYSMPYHALRVNKECTTVL